MRKIAAAALVLCLMSGTSALAQDNDHHHDKAAGPPKSAGPTHGGPPGGPTAHAVVVHPTGGPVGPAHPPAAPPAHSTPAAPSARPSKAARPTQQVHSTPAAASRRPSRAAQATRPARSIPVMPTGRASARPASAPAGPGPPTVSNTFRAASMSAIATSGVAGIGPDPAASIIVRGSSARCCPTVGTGRSGTSPTITTMGCPCRRTAMSGSATGRTPCWSMSTAAWWSHRFRASSTRRF